MKNFGIHKMKSCLGSLGFLERPKIPQRTGVAAAIGYGVWFKAVTLQTECLHSSSRRAVGRPRSDEMPLEPVRCRREPSGAFLTDFLVEGERLRSGDSHTPCSTASTSASARCICSRTKTKNAASCSIPSDRSGTAMRSGWSLAAARCSPRFRMCMRRRSPVSTSHSCCCWQR